MVWLLSTVALYTFGLLDPAVEPAALADFLRRGGDIFGATGRAPGFLGRANDQGGGDAAYVPGADFGPWGSYVLPLGLPDFAGHDPHVHIATLSLWQDLGSAHRFVYGGLHREALTLRYEWFLRGPWPGHVLWDVEDGTVPRWADGVARLEALARDGESARHFTFGWRRGRA